MPAARSRRRSGVPGQCRSVSPRRRPTAYADMQRAPGGRGQARKDGGAPRRRRRSAAPRRRMRRGRNSPAAGRGPALSILVPVYNEFDVTVECLLSIAARAGRRRAFEVVVADDCSTDPAMARLADVAEPRVGSPVAQRLGFIRNCNAAFAACRGDYVLLLNNDAQVVPVPSTAWSRRSTPMPASPRSGRS